jgi:hypothetical protein
VHATIGDCEHLCKPAGQNSTPDADEQSALSHAFQRRAGEKEVREPHRRGRAPGNLAALAGGTGDLDPYLLTATQTTQFPIDSGRLTEPVSTRWVTYPGPYSASCEQGAGPAGSR